MQTKKLLKTLLAVGMISLAKTSATYLLKEKEEEQPANARIEETDLSEILSDIKSEMVDEMNKLDPEEKLLANYVRGRIATVNDIENRLRK